MCQCYSSKTLRESPSNYSRILLSKYRRAHPIANFFEEKLIDLNHPKQLNPLS